MWRPALALVSLCFLAACTNKPTLTVEALCGEKGRGGVVESPEFIIDGKTQTDQNWIDNTLEGLIGACDWQRPKPKPKEKVTKKGKKKGVFSRFLSSK